MAVTGGQLPYMGDYQRRQRDYQLAYERAKTTLASRRSDILNEYGFQGRYNQQTGAMESLRPSSTNLTGGYQQQRRGQYQEMQDLKENQLGRGFTGGLMQQERNQMRFFQGAEDADFMRSLMTNLRDVNVAQSQSMFDYRQARGDLLQDTVNQAIGDRLFTPAVLKDLQAGAGGAKADVPEGIFYRDQFFQSRAGLADWLQERRKGSRKGIYRRWAESNPKRAKKLRRISTKKKRKRLSGPFPGGASTPGPR